MRCEGYESAAEARRRRREICRSFACISPWSIFRRWSGGGKSRFSKSKFAERNWGKCKIDGDLGLQSELATVPSSSAEDFPETGKEASLSIGVGYGLIYLLKYELNKMVELRRRIESLLHHFQTEIESRGEKRLHIPTRPSICSSLTNIHDQEILYTEEHDSNDDKHPEIGHCCDPFRRECSSRMDQLEAELEAELCRLHLQEDGELSYPEVNEEQNAAESRLELCCEEADDQHESSSDGFHGVSPRDLERRLHEVLEARQQERIEELESGLEYAMQQLEERERDLSMWRETACVVAQHLPFHIQYILSSGEKQAMEPEFEVFGFELCRKYSRLVLNMFWPCLLKIVRLEYCVVLRKFRACLLCVVGDVLKIESEVELARPLVSKILV